MKLIKWGMIQKRLNKVPLKPYVNTKEEMEKPIIKLFTKYKNKTKGKYN